MNMSSKEPTLNKRLNDLEYELKELHDRILKKRLVFGRKNLIIPEKTISKYSILRKEKQFLSENNALSPINEIRNTVRGLGTIKKNRKDVKTASLTEITSLSSGVPKEVQFIKKNNFKNPHGLPRMDRNYPKKKSKFVENRKIIKEKTIGTLNDDYYHKKLRSTLKEAISEVTAKSPKEIATKEVSYKLGTMNYELEDRMLDLKLLKERIESVKKKLRDERTKREIAERAITGYRRRLAILEGKVVNTEEKPPPGESDENRDKDLPLSELVASIQKQLQEGYSKNPIGDKGPDEIQKTLMTLEKELGEERGKRLEAEKLVNELKQELEESKKKITQLEEGRKLAIAMADQFREKSTNAESQEIKKLKSEKAALEKELRSRKEMGEVSPETLKNLMERAERAEKELIEKMKQCNNFMAKSSLNDPDVVKLIEKHKKAYAELQSEKKSKEMELKNRCNGLLKDIEAATVAADKRFKEISDKYNQANNNLKKKESEMDRIKTEKYSMENELKSIRIKLQDFENKKVEQEDLIRCLKDSIKKNDELTKKTNEDSKELHASLEKRCKKLESTIAEQDRLIEKLKLELEQEKDSLKIKDKMLQDQSDTIKCLRLVADNTKRSLDEERSVKHQLLDDIDKLKTSREKLHTKLASMEQKLSDAEDERAKENFILKQLEQKVRQKHIDWQHKMSQLSHEKEKAIQTARFATEKLIKAVREYEDKLATHKKIQGLLNSALKDKDYQLHVAKQQVQDLNEEVWKSAKITEKVRNDLQTKLKRACEVCTDAINTQIDLDVGHMISDSNSTSFKDILR